MSIVWILFVAVGLVAAFTDLARYRIPNLTIAALCLLFLAAAVFHHGNIPWFDHLSAGILSLLVGVSLYVFRMMGAGDAKLLAVFALWAGLEAVIPLVFWIAVAGLVLLAVLLALRRLAPTLQEAMRGWGDGQLPKVLKKGEGVPYGVAIVAGTIIASHTFPGWLWQV
jgi:prepilin peptidase CpaA